MSHDYAEQVRSLLAPDRAPKTNPQYSNEFRASDMARYFFGTDTNDELPESWTNTEEGFQRLADIFNRQRSRL